MRLTGKLDPKYRSTGKATDYDVDHSCVDRTTRVLVSEPLTICIPSVPGPSWSMALAGSRNTHVVVQYYCT
jgi:hypothetical protein